MTKQKNNKPITQVDVLPMQLDRTMILDILSENIQIMNKKVKGNRIRDTEKEKIKVTQMKAVVYGCKVYNEIYKDYQLDNLERELKLIKNAVEQSKNQERLAEDLEIVEATLEKLNNDNRSKE